MDSSAREIHLTSKREQILKMLRLNELLLILNVWIIINMFGYKTNCSSWKDAPKNLIV